MSAPQAWGFNASINSSNQTTQDSLFIQLSRIVLLWKRLCDERETRSIWHLVGVNMVFGRNLALGIPKLGNSP